MYIGNVQCKENICRLILGLLFFKFDFYVAEKHGVLKLNATGNYVEISYPESFNLKCTGFDTLVWEFETIFLNEAIRLDFRKELVYSKIGRTFFNGIFSFEGSFLSTRKCSCDFIHTAPEVPVSVCLSVIGKTESFVRYADMCSSEVEFGSKQEMELSCHVNGVSHPKIKWFRNGKPVSALDDSSKLAIKEVDENHSGFYECKVENGVAVETGKIIQTLIRASYISPRRMILDINSVDMTEIYCSADGTPLPKVSWYHREGSLLDAIFQEKFSAKNYNNVHTLFRKFLIDILKDTSSFFKCSVRKPFGIGLIMGNSTWMNVEAVRIYRTNMKSPTIEAYVDEDLELYCYMDGVPQANLTWYFNSEPFPDNVTGTEFSDDSMKLVISRLVEGNSGLYECRAENKHGVVSYSSYLTVKKAEKKTDSKRLAVLGSLSLLLLLTFALFFRNRRRFCKPQESMLLEQLLGEQTFLYEVLDPNIAFREEANMMPYDEKYEFPQSRLKFGRTLGQGAFGLVIKAEAFGLKQDESSTTVAVKITKEKSDLNQQKALMSELKILIHLGHHVNIVNLLGAVTKYVRRGELMVIVEYCRFGNLRNYLLKHRHKFAPQENLCSEKTTIGKKAHNASPKSSICGSHDDEHCNYSDSSLLTDFEDGKSSARNLTAGLCKPSSGIGPELEDASSESSDSDSEIFLRLGKKKHVLTTTDLICYAFQCARGMNYLAFKKLIHRDLAARNVLLADDNVVKICDFGLTKDLYQYPGYAKTGNVALPIKWMAIESIGERIFSTKSDVWSFGVLLWELFTLGSDPYPGIEVDEKFYRKLKEGYRMEKPALAVDTIYQIMTDCWKLNALDRPNFARLSDTLGNLLESQVTQHYIKLNEPYEEKKSVSSGPQENDCERR